MLKEWRSKDGTNGGGDDVKIVYLQEPIDEWTDIQGANLLDMFYKDGPRNAYTFQTWTFITRVEQLEKCIADLPQDTNVIIFVERSRNSDRNVFGQTLHDDGVISDMEWVMYNKWFNWLSGKAPKIDKTLYLRTSNVDINMSRIKKRNRPEEAQITLEYLQSLHDKHEAWLYDDPINASDITVIDADVDFEHSEQRFDEIVQQLTLSGTFSFSDSR